MVFVESSAATTAALKIILFKIKAPMQHCFHTAESADTEA